MGRVLIMLLVLLALGSFNLFAQQQSTATLRGTVADEFGGLIVGATVTVADASGVQKQATTDEEGRYTFTGLAPGRYTVNVSAPGFAAYDNEGVELTVGRTDPLNVTLRIAVEQVEVTVSAEEAISTDPENNLGAVTLRGTDLDALPDDPDDLTEALQALAGPSAGQEGGEIFIDGFSGGRLPPKESIREIRINRNPFSAEYDRLGYGRIEIFTKPGTDRFRGQGFINFNDESLNSRNPFAPNRAPYQVRRYGGNFSGPISRKRASFFFDVQRNETDDNDVINAIILDPAFNIVPFLSTVLTPRRTISFSPRLDYQINSTNTLVARYTYQKTERQNMGLGSGFALPSVAFDSESTQQTFQLTETSVINKKIINETRFQYIRQRSNQTGANALPTIRVLEAFTGGGSNVGFSFDNEDRFELSNFTSWAVGTHALKAGGRLRVVRVLDVSPQNFNGTFTFAGGTAPLLDANNQIVLDAQGQPVLTTITSIERYRRTLLFQQQGFTNAQIRALGGGPTQFSIAGGDPKASVTQADFGGFIQDDWRVRPNFTLSLGLRYETQNNVHSWTDFAPRVAFAWAPGAGANARQQKTVIRGGFGLFYTRVADSLTLQANRFNGTNQQQFVVTANTVGGLGVLNQATFTNAGVSNVPTTAELTAFQIPQTTRQLSGDLRTPYTMQTALSLERQLPYNIGLSVNFINTRTLHVLRSRNINAPLPGSITVANPGGVRPLGDIGNIFQYESTGRFNQSQLIVSLNSRFSRNYTLFATYTYNRARSDTDGANTFPANQYDLTTEYGRSFQDIRHRFSIVGSISGLPWGIRLNPYVVAYSGVPFNITIGRDINGDTLFTERPAFATDLTRPSVVATRFGTFDTNPVAGQEIIPRNFGQGPAFFTTNLRISKTWGFGGERPLQGAGAGGQTGGGRGQRGAGGGGGGGRGGRGGRGGGGFGGGMGGADAGGGTAERYNLTFSVSIQNIFNNVNLAPPVGNLSSPLFGQSVSTAGRYGFGGNQAAGNRTIEAMLRFSF
ncbi:MAG: carboxypeptidase regulatory-like domain-containing protein [Pyrinomonadaceae bacterium]|nr:carboxypeptidase regulatory-like domain-containing protein [Pyrinomonadaceae bacterium]